MRQSIVLSRFLVVLAAVALLTFSVQAADAPPKKLLFFTKSARFEHSVVKKTADKPSYAEKILNDLGKKHNFEITETKDGAVFTKENLDKYDAIVFYTSGDLTIEKAKDGSPPMTKEGKEVLFEAVKNGKGFMVIHNAMATFDKTKSGEKPDPYIDMIGGESIGHGEQQMGKNKCVDPKFPGFAAVAGGIEWNEEWYSIKNFAEDIHVILVHEPAGMKGALYIRPPYPATWARMHGKGRVFATSIGHREDVWDRPEYQAILVGGIDFVTGRADADLTPNIKEVAPEYATLPKKEEKKKEEPKKEEKK